MKFESLIERIVKGLKVVEGVRAIVLGGSRARGTHIPSSDVDLGIYYHPDKPLDMAQLSRIATSLDDAHRPDLVTPMGEWGPWINGGGWLRIQSYPVDFLYRDLEKVAAVIHDCLQGRVNIFYQPGHPLGFVSSMYLAEVAVCRPLWDPEGVLAALKKQIDPYPASLQQVLIRKFAWEIDFSIETAKKSIDRADVTYAAGCCFRSVMCMLQVLFALNKQHWLNEKGALALADTFTMKPELLRPRVERAFQALDAKPASIEKAIHILEQLSAEVSMLIEGI
ncbi:MAG TPA: nucleotidyltransferase domain-containing protein [Anaerolineales bacterium]|nr:nucleotidyltransferase domain-containing protein [Anaerolineales bacterium]